MEKKNTYIGREIGNYRIVREIGGGGFGNIYLAEHVLIQNRVVVIKILRGVYLSSEEERNGFIQEAQILENLKEHPHILSILDLGIDESVPYLITAYAEQGSLRDRFKSRNNQPFSVPETLTIVQQVGEALQYAHKRNVVHRDMKPENILFNSKGEALLADFGISTVLSTTSVKHTEVMGTPAYMAPEQFRGEISRRSDQYALACITYEMLCGHRPFGAGDFISLGYRHVTEPPPHIRQSNATIPLHIEQTLLRAMAKERSARFEDIATFLHALQQIDQRQYGPVPYIQQSQSAPLARLDTVLASPTPPPPPPSYQFATPINTPARVANTPARPAAFQPNYPGGGNILISPDQKTPDKFHSLGAGWRLLALSCYLLPVIGWLLYFSTGRDNRFARYHALQSFLIWLLFGIFVKGITVTSGDPVPQGGTTFVFAIISVYLICGFVASPLGKYLRVPIISMLARRYADRRQRSKMKKHRYEQF
jgi:serine/threonine protein kinase